MRRIGRLAADASQLLLLQTAYSISAANVANAARCSTVTAHMSPTQVDIADSGSSGCEVSVTWSASGTSTDYVSREITDVFIILDESGSVGSDNYDLMIAFVKSFVESLDHSAQIFDSGGKIGVTEFSWNPDDMMEFTSLATCVQQNGSVSKCFAQSKCESGKRGRNKCTTYYISTGKYAGPNSYHLSSTLADTLAAVDAEGYEPSSHGTSSDDYQWLAYRYTDLGDAIWYTALMAKAASDDASRPAPPDRQVMLVVTDGEHNVGKYQPLAGADLARSYGLDVYAIGVGDVDDSQQDDIGGPATGEDSDDFVLDLADFAALDDAFSAQILSLLVTPCATDAEMAVTVADTVGNPTSVTCSGGGVTCETHGSTMTWTIAELDATERTANYHLDVCDCTNVGTVNTLARVTYTDSETSIDAYPVLPDSLEVQVTDSTWLCGTPAVALEKIGSYNGDSAAASLGDTVTYDFTILNTGTTSIRELSLEDSKVLVTCTRTLDGLLLAPGVAVACESASGYVISQDDIDAGSVESEATISGVSLSPSLVLISSTASDVTKLPRQHSISVEKTLRSITSAQGLNTGYSDAGDSGTFDIVVTNTGNTVLSTVKLTDDTFRDGMVTCDHDFSATTSRFLPAAHPDGVSIVCEGKVYLTSSHVDRGITGTAKVTAVSPSNTVVEHKISTRTQLEQLAEISVANSGTWIDDNESGWADEGEIVSYRITVTNEGTVSLGSLAVADSGGAVTCTVPDLGSLGQGESYACGASRQVSQADVNAGMVNNEVTATAMAVNGEEVKASDEAVVALPQDARVGIQLAATWHDKDSSGYTDESELVVYSFQISNGGNVDLADVHVSSSELMVACDDRQSLGVGHSYSCGGSYSVLSLDITAGLTESAVTVEAHTSMAEVVSSAVLASTPLKKPPSIALGVTGLFMDDSGNGYAEAGERTTYEFTVANNGYATLYEVTIADPLLVSVDGSSTIECNTLSEVSGVAVIFVHPLAADAAIACTGVHTLTASDVDHLKRESIVTVAAKDEYSFGVTDSVTQTVLFEQVGSIRLGLTRTYAKEFTKAAAATTDTVEYSYVLVNNGQLSLFNIVVSDATLAAHGSLITCTDVDGETVGDVDAGVVSGLAAYPDKGLAPATSITCTGIDTVTQIEINAAVKETNPIVKAWHETSVEMLEDTPLLATASSTVNLAQVPKIDVKAIGSHLPEDGIYGIATVGDSVQYEIFAKNTGNVDMAALELTGVMFKNDDGSYSMDCASEFPAPWFVSTSLGCTPTYAITQADIDAGLVMKTVSATGTLLSGGTKTASASATVVLRRTQALSLVVTQTFVDADAVRGVSAGDSIRYDIGISNVGTTTLTAVRVTSSILDAQFASGYSSAKLLCDTDPSTLRLTPGKTVNCAAVAKVLQHHIDSGGVNNIVGAAASGPDEEPSATADMWLPLAQSPAVNIAGSSVWIDGPEADGLTNVGEKIAFNGAITNRGITTLSKFCITAASFGNGCQYCQAPEALLPREHFKCTLQFEVVQSHIDAGAVHMDISVSAIDHRGSGTRDDASTLVTLRRVHKLSLEVEGQYNGDAQSAAVGDLVVYESTIVNRGTTTIFGLILRDTLVSFKCSPQLHALALAPDGKVACTSMGYTITQADIDSGTVLNYATLDGWSPAPGSVRVTAREADLVALPRQERVSVVRMLESVTTSQGLNKDYSDQGDSATFKVTVSNTGNTKLRAVRVTDSMFDPEDLDCDHNFSSHTSGFMPASDQDGTVIVCRGTILLASSQVDEGGIHGTAKVDALGSDGKMVTDAHTMTVLLDQLAGISVVQNGMWEDADSNGRPDAGEFVSCDITVANKGTVTLHIIEVMDTSGGTSCTTPDSGLLAQGESYVCTTLRKITQEELNDGSVANTASVIATAPNDEAVTDSQTWAETLLQQPEINIDMLAVLEEDDTGMAGYADKDESIVYTITVSNVGNVDLSDVSVLHAGVTHNCVDRALLGAGDTFHCTAAYSLSWGDIKAGLVNPVATVSGYDPSDVLVSDVASALVMLKKPPSISLDVTGLFIDDFLPSDNKAEAGETVIFHFKITNNGHALLFDVAIMDQSLVAGNGRSTVVCDKAFIVPRDSVTLAYPLAVDETVTCSGAYSLTVQDIDNLERITIGTVTAKDEYSYEVGASDTETVALSQVGSVRVAIGYHYVKQVNGEAASASDELQYTFTITNTGLLSLFDINVEDVALAEGKVTITCTDVDAQTTDGIRNGMFMGLATYPDKGLRPAASLTCTANDVVSQAEINAGVKTASIEVQARHESKAGSLDSVVFHNFSTDVTLKQVPGCALSKVAQYIPRETTGYASVGEFITYEITATNNGNVDVKEAAMIDAMFRSSDGSYAMECSDGIPTPWLVDAEFVCRPVYTITQADIDAGVVKNTVTIAGSPASGGSMVDTANASQVLLGGDGISVAVATSVANSDAVNGASKGYVIEYEVVLENTGTTTLKSISVMGTVGSGTAGVEILCEPSLGRLKLAPGASAECSGTYSMLQLDVNSGEVSTTVTVKAVGLNGQTSAESQVSEPFQPLSSLRLETTATIDTGDDGVLNAGDIIEYSMDVRNVGSTCLTDVVLVNSEMSTLFCRPLYTGVDGLEDMFCPGSDKFACKGTYVARQSDMDAGVHITTSAVSSLSPNRTVVGNENTHLIDLLGEVALSLEMEGDFTPQSAADLAAVGEIVSYTFVVRNTGSVTLSAIDLVSPTLSAPSCAPDVFAVAPLAPGDLSECTGYYTITQANIDSGEVATGAGAIADSSLGTVRSSNISIQHLLYHSEVSIEISGYWQDGDEADARAAPGEEIHYKYVVHNLGTVTLTNTVVSDASTASVMCFQATLAPGDSFTCTYKNIYWVDQTDVDSGKAVKRVTVSTTDPFEVSLDASTTSEVSLNRMSSIDIRKHSVLLANTDRASIGDEVEYSYTILNDGTTTLSDAVISDDKVSTGPDKLSCNGTLASISPQTIVVCQGTNTYRITQDDINAGISVSNASIEAMSPSPEARTIVDSGISAVEIPQQHVISIFKEVSSRTTDLGLYPTIVDAEDYLYFSIAVRNIGNTWLSQVKVSDALLPDIACSPDLSSGDTPFAPDDDKIICTASAKVNQSMVDQGFVKSTAKVLATPPSGNNPAEAEHTLQTELPQRTAISIAVSVPSGQWVDTNGDGEANPADLIEYAFTIANTGSVSLHDVKVTSSLPSAEAIECPALPSNNLLPGASITCFASYKLIQGDIDAGSVVNKANVEALSASNEAIFARSIDEDTSMVRRAGIALAMESIWTDSARDGFVDGYADEGEGVSYTFTISNSGNVRVTGIELIHSGALVSCNHPAYLYPSDDPYECTEMMALVWGEIEAGLKETEAILTASDAALLLGGDLLEADVRSCVSLPSAPSISLSVEGFFVDGGGESGNFLADVGETVRYTMTVVNDGHATLSSIILENDALVSDGKSTITCDVPVSTPTTRKSEGKIVLENDLAPREVMRCGGIHVVTADDIDSRETVSTTSVKAVDKVGREVADSETTSVSLDQVGSMAMRLTHFYADNTSAAVVGQTVDFSFVLSNNGLLTLFDVSMRSDYLAERGSKVTCTDAGGNTIAGAAAGSIGGMAPYPDNGMAPGQSISCHSSVSVLQAEINDAEVSLSASATAKYKGDADALDESATAALGNYLVYLVQVLKLGIVKYGTHAAANSDGLAATGESVAFSITVSNDGNVDLVDVHLIDSMFQDFEGAYDKLACADGVPSMLAVGRSFKCSPAMSIAQSDIDAGLVRNTARVTASTGLGSLVNGAAKTTIALLRNASLSFQVSGVYTDSDSTPGPSAGDSVSYSLLVKNTGTATIWGAVVSAELGDRITCVPALESLQLAPGDISRCSSSYEVTQDDLDSAEVRNAAAVTAISVTGVVDAKDDETVAIARSSAITVDKRGTVNTGEDGVLTSGDAISYTFVVTNTGHTCLTMASIDDDIAVMVNCPDIDLSGEATFCPSRPTFTCTGSAVIVQKNMDQGFLEGTVVVTASDPDDASVTASSWTNNYLGGVSTITLANVQATSTPTDIEGYASTGDTVVYTLTVINEGTVTVHDIGLDVLQEFTWSCDRDILSGGTLAPETETTCTGLLILTQAHLDDQQVVCIVTVSAIGATGDTTEDNHLSTLELKTRSSISVDLFVIGETWIDSDEDGDCDPGEGVAYVSFVENTGITSLNVVTVSDDLLGDETVCDWPYHDQLKPGESITCTGTYEITQSDIDAGIVANVAFASGEDFLGHAVHESDPHKLTLPRRPAISLAETCQLNAADSIRAEVGEGVSCVFTIVNTGSTTLGAVGLTSKILAQGQMALECDTPLAELPRGGTITCTSISDHLITQADIDVGQISDDAGVSSRSPASSPTETSDTATCNALLPRQSRIVIEEQVTTITAANGVDSSFTDAGDSFEYSITILNTGNTWLRNLNITDPMFEELACDGDYDSNDARLAPGETVVCAAALTLEQTHVDKGCVTNLAEVSAVGSDETRVDNKVNISTCIVGLPSVSLVVDGSAFVDTNGDGDTDAGEVVVYRLGVQNVGTVTIGSIALTVDPSNGVVCAPDLPHTLAPGLSFQCEANYTIVQDDVDKGVVLANAKVTAASPKGWAVSGTATVSVELTRAPSISLVTHATWKGSANESILFATAGDAITLLYTVVNTGNVRLENPTVLDANARVSCNDLPSVLDPEHSAVCSGSSVLQWSTVEAGIFESTSRVTSTDMLSKRAITHATATAVDLPPPPSVQLDILGTFNDDSPEGTAMLADVGETISYEFTITNDGHAVLGAISLEDVDTTSGISPTVSCEAMSVTASDSTSITLEGTLAVRATVTCTGSYAISQGDVQQLEPSFSAKVTAENGDGYAVEATDSAVVSLDQVGSLLLVIDPSYSKVTTGDSATTSDVIQYKLIITNTGLLDVFKISVTAWADGEGIADVLTCHDVDEERVTVDDTSTGIGGLASYPKEGLQAREHLTCHFSAAVGQTEINAAAKWAGATVAGWYKDQAGDLSNQISEIGTLLVPLIQNPSALVTKEAVYTPAREDGLATIVDMIEYVIVAFNDGNVDLAAVGLTDDMFKSDEGELDMDCSGGTPGSLAVGASVTCLSSAVITQDDIDVGVVESTVTMTATAPSSAVVEASALSSTELARAAVLDVTVSTAFEDDDGEAGSTVGDRIRHEFSVRNEGTVTLSALTIAAPLLSELEASRPDALIVCSPSLLDFKLAPGESVPCLAYYQVSQADIDIGSVVSTVTSSAKSSVGDISDEDSTEQALDQIFGITVVAVATVDMGWADATSAGDSVKVVHTITNTGNTCLRDVQVSDLSIDDLTCTSTFTGDDYFCPLKGRVFNCHGVKYTTQQDVDSGEMLSEISVSSYPLYGSDVVGDSFRLVTQVVGNYAVSIEQTVVYLPEGGKGGGSAVGDTIVYTVIVANHGSMTLSSVRLVDSKVETLSCEPDIISGTDLAAGATASCTVSYLITQANIDANKVISVANVTASSPSGETAFNQTRHTQQLVQASAISIRLSSGHLVAAADGNTRKGDTILYAIDIFNSGNTCLTNLEIEDMRLGSSLECHTVPDFFCPKDLSISCTGGYTLTQADVDTSSVFNVATVTASPPAVGGTGAVSAQAEDSVIWGVYPSLALDASMYLVSASTLPSAGDKLVFSFNIRNSGTTSLTRITLLVPRLEATAVAIKCTPALVETLVLAPEGVVLCSSTVTLSQDDLDVGGVTSTVFSRGEASDGQTALAESIVEQELKQAPGLSVVQVGVIADEDGDGFGDAMETIGYTTTVRNIGNVRLGGVTVIDSLDQSTLACDDGFQAAVTPDGASQLLLPGEGFECTAMYSITQEHADSGEVVNLATASAVSHDAQSSQVHDTDWWKQELLQDASLQISITGTFVDDGVLAGEADTGDVMQYEFIVRNIGSVTLRNVDVTASVLSDDEVSCPAVSLAPSESMVCSATLPLSDGHIDSYQVETTVTATAVGPAGQTPTFTGESYQRLDAEPSLSLTKVGKHVDQQYTHTFSAVAGNGLADAGEYITYEITVVNTGMLSVHKIVVEEALNGADVTCDTHHLELAHSMVCNATYPFNQGDLDRGGVRSLAAAIGYGPVKSDGQDRSSTEAEGSAWVDLPQHASVEITEECLWQDGSEGDGLPDAGELLLLTHIVRNTGSVTLTSGVVREGGGGGEAVDCSTHEDEADVSLDSVAPNDEVTCTSTKTITQSDIDLGAAASTAIVTARSPLEVSANATASCFWKWGVIPSQIETTVSGSFVDSNDDALAQVGETVTQNITVTNTGKVTVTLTTVTEKVDTSLSTLTSEVEPTERYATIKCLPPLSSTPSLAPGESLSCTAESRIDRNDINLGELAVEVTVTAAGPDKSEVVSTSSHIQVLPSTPGISLTLEDDVTGSFDTDGDGKSSVGDVVAFTLNVTNTGTVDLSRAKVDGNALDGLSCQQISPSAVDQRRRLDRDETIADQRTFPSGKAFTCTGTRTLEQDDVDNGVLRCIASVSATAKDTEETFVEADAEELLTLTPYPSLIVVKVGQLIDSDADNLAGPDEAIQYDITVINTGNVRMQDVQVVDNMLPDLICSDKSQPLEPQGSISCAASYKLKQDDVDSGIVTNQVIATAMDPSSASYSATDSDDVRLTRALRLDLHMTSTYVTGVDDTGTIDFVFEVTNLGTVTIYKISVVDAALPGEVVCPVDPLAPDASIICNTSEPYLVTREDMILGSIVNNATLTGEGPLDDDETVTVSDSVTTLTPSGAGKPPVALTFTLVGTTSLVTSMRRLAGEEKSCGWEAIVAACNAAFSVDNCQCVRHSDGDCKSSTMVADEGAPETAGGGRTTASVEEPGTTITSSSTPVDQNGGTTLEDAATVDNTASETSSISIASTTVENGSSVRTVPGSSATDQVNKRAFEAESSSTPARATQVAVDAQGRVLQNLPLLEVTTTLEIEFVTDVHGTGAMKAAAAIDSFADVVDGFEQLLISDCFDDAMITSLNVSQASSPPSRRVPNDYTSSTSYSNHIQPLAVDVPSALGLSSDGGGLFAWFTIFVALIAFGLCASVAMVSTCMYRRAANINRKVNPFALGSMANTPRRSIDNSKDFEVHSVECTVRSGRFPPGEGRGNGGRGLLKEPSEVGIQNRLFSPSMSGGFGRPLPGSVGMLQSERSWQRKACLIENHSRHLISRDPEARSMEDFEIPLSALGNTTGSEAGTPTSSERTPNPMFNGAHAPRLSALDFGQTHDRDEDEIDGNVFWRRRGDSV